MTSREDQPDAVLDDPVGVSLAGRHAHLARRRGRVATYLPEVGTFCAVPHDPGPEDWADLVALLGPHGLVDLFSSDVDVPTGWETVFDIEGTQMVGPAAPDPTAAEAAVELTEDDVPEILDLVAAAEPGPYWPRSIEVGRHWGLREGDRLVAMVAERFATAGWSEISTVCTHPDWRGRGLARTLVSTAVADLAALGQRAFLHLKADNHPARKLYEDLGFHHRRDVRFRGYRVPASAALEQVQHEGREIQVVHGGDLGCAKLLVLLRKAITSLADGTEVHLETSDPVAPIDLPAWCRLTGHEYLGPVPDADPAPRYAIRIAPARPTVEDRPWHLA